MSTKLVYKDLVNLAEENLVAEQYCTMTHAHEVIYEVANNIAVEENYENSEVKIKSICSKGANYAYKLYEVLISALDKPNLELFGKVAIIGDKVRSSLNVSLYEKEFFFYKHLLNNYKMLEEKYEIPDEHKLRVPKCYGYKEEYLKETIVMENLLRKKFTVYDRLVSVNWAYASKCVKQLATLHCLSVVYSKQNPKSFGDVVDYLNFTYPKQFLEKSVDNAVAAVKEEYRERFSAFLAKYMKDDVMQTFYKPYRLAVFAHGDFRPSNLMYRVLEDGTWEIAVVDFQTLHTGNPVTDLLYFIFNGSDADFRRRHYHQLLEHYYTELSDSLRRFGFEPNAIYSKQDFEQDLKEVLPYGLVIVITTLPIVTIDAENIPEIDEKCCLNAKTSSLFSERLNDIISDYIEMGVL